MIKYEVVIIDHSKRWADQFPKQMRNKFINDFLVTFNNIKNNTHLLVFLHGNNRDYIDWDDGIHGNFFSEVIKNNGKFVLFSEGTAIRGEQCFLTLMTNLEAKEHTQFIVERQTKPVNLIQNQHFFYGETDTTIEQLLGLFKESQIMEQLLYLYPIDILCQRAAQQVPEPDYKEFIIDWLRPCYKNVADDYTKKCNLFSEDFIKMIDQINPSPDDRKKIEDILSPEAVSYLHRIWCMAIGKPQKREEGIGLNDIFKKIHEEYEGVCKLINVTIKNFRTVTG